MIPKAYRTVVGFAERGQVMPDLHHEVSHGEFDLAVKHDGVFRPFVDWDIAVEESYGEIVRGELHGIPQDMLLDGEERPVGRDARVPRRVQRRKVA